MSTMSGRLSEQIKILHKYSACDVCAVPRIDIELSH